MFRTWLETSVMILPTISATLGRGVTSGIRAQERLSSPNLEVSQLSQRENEQDDVVYQIIDKGSNWIFSLREENHRGFSKLVKTRGLLRLLRGSWVSTKEPRGRGRMCLVFMRSGGDATTEKKI
ncbi:hypothetical protein YC2023_033543 [Brassica napus]